MLKFWAGTAAFHVIQAVRAAPVPVNTSRSWQIFMPRSQIDRINSVVGKQLAVALDDAA